MKHFKIFLVAVALLWLAFAAMAQAPSAVPATQAQVNAGQLGYPFMVTPQTLAGWTGGGSNTNAITNNWAGTLYLNGSARALDITATANPSIYAHFTSPYLFDSYLRLAANGSGAYWWFYDYDGATNSAIFAGPITSQATVLATNFVATGNITAGGTFTGNGGGLTNVSLPSNPVYTTPVTASGLNLQFSQTIYSNTVFAYGQFTTAIGGLTSNSIYAAVTNGLLILPATTQGNTNLGAYVGLNLTNLDENWESTVVYTNTATNSVLCLGKFSVNSYNGTTNLRYCVVGGVSNNTPFIASATFFFSGRQNNSFNMQPTNVIQVTLRSTKTTATVTAVNLSNPNVTNNSITYSAWYAGSGDTTYGITQPNSGVWGLGRLSAIDTGNVYVQSWTVTSHTPRNAWFDFIGDSKTSGCEVGTSGFNTANIRYADQIAYRLQQSTIVNAGNSDRMQEFVNDWYYVTNYETPTRICFNGGRNNFADGTTNQFYSLYTNFVTAITSACPASVQMLPIEENGSQTILSNYMVQVIPAPQLFDPNVHFSAQSTFCGPDGIHPNFPGHTAIATAFCEAYGIVQNYNPVYGGKVWFGTNNMFYLGDGLNGIGIYQNPQQGNATPTACLTFQGSAIVPQSALGMNNQNITFSSAGANYGNIGTGGTGGASWGNVFVTSNLVAQCNLAFGTNTGWNIFPATNGLNFGAWNFCDSNGTPVLVHYLGSGTPPVVKYISLMP